MAEMPGYMGPVSEKIDALAEIMDAEGEIDRDEVLGALGELIETGEQVYSEVQPQWRESAMDRVGGINRRAIMAITEADEAERVVPPLTDSQKVSLAGKFAMFGALMESKRDGEPVGATPTEAVDTDSPKP